MVLSSGRPSWLRISSVYILFKVISSQTKCFNLSIYFNFHFVVVVKMPLKAMLNGCLRGEGREDIKGSSLEVPLFL